MVRGLDIFRSWFAEYADQYVLIGGTAASLSMEEAGLGVFLAFELSPMIRRVLQNGVFSHE